MLEPELPSDEVVRLDTLRSLHILDTAPEERFDRLTRLAKRLFNVPMALVSLVDQNRQWFKSCIGLDATETPRNISFCGHAILEDDILVVQDACADARFHDNPLVVGAPGVRFYAGCPLSAPNGSKMGTLCLIDTVPREFSAEDHILLRDLAGMAEQEMAAERLATMDDLTSLSNRRGFERLAQHALNVCLRMGLPATLLFFDLDKFKNINDTYGHAEGDRALTTFAALLRTALRDSDVTARMGGDEFVALLVNADGVSTSEVVARFQQALDAHNHDAQSGYAILCSVGQITYASERHASLAELLAEGDDAMYAEKQASRSAPLS